MPWGHFPRRNDSSFIILKWINILNLKYGFFFRFNFPGSKLYHKNETTERLGELYTCYPVIFFFSSGWNKASFYWPALGTVSACRLLVKIPTSPVANVSRLPLSWLQSSCRWGGCLSWQSGGKSCRWILLPRPHADNNTLIGKELDNSI